MYYPGRYYAEERDRLQHELMKQPVRAHEAISHEVTPQEAFDAGYGHAFGYEVPEHYAFGAEAIDHEAAELNLDHHYYKPAVQEHLARQMDFSQH